MLITQISHLQSHSNLSRFLREITKYIHRLFKMTACIIFNRIFFRSTIRQLLQQFKKYVFNDIKYWSDV